MLKSLDIFISEFGFPSCKNFITSTFGFCLNKKAFVLSVFLSGFSMFIEKYIGLTSLVFTSFVTLLFLEFITGIKASLKEGKKIESRKFGRVILKLVIYTLIIGIINSFKNDIIVPVIFNQQINIYSAIHFITINLILIQLLISLFENLSRLGFEESNKIFRVLKKIAAKYINLDKKENE